MKHFVVNTSISKKTKTKKNACLTFLKFAGVVIIRGTLRTDFFNVQIRLVNFNFNNSILCTY